MKRTRALFASSTLKLRANSVGVETEPQRDRGAALGGDCSELQRLYAALGGVQAATNPRTYKLLESGNRKIAQKVIEEAGEVALEAVKRNPRGVVRESADLLYHLVVVWRRAGVEPAEVWREMQRRADAFGIAEKRQKSAKHGAADAQGER